MDEPLDYVIRWVATGVGFGSLVWVGWAVIRSKRSLPLPVVLCVIVCGCSGAWVTNRLIGKSYRQLICEKGTRLEVYSSGAIWLNGRFVTIQDVRDAEEVYLNLCADVPTAELLAERDLPFGEVKRIVRYGGIRLGLLPEGRVVPVALYTAHSTTRAVCDRELYVLVDEEGVRFIEHCPDTVYGLEPMSREELRAYIVGDDEGKSTWVSTIITDDAKMKDVVELAQAIEQLGKDKMFYDWL